MSKHFKKYALLLIAGLVICSMSCKKDSKEGGEITGFVIEAENVIDANDDIATVKAISGMEDEMEVIATGKYKNGGFKLTLPSTLNSKYLLSISEDIEEGMVVSDPNAKVGAANWFVAYDKDGNEIGEFDCVYYDEETNTNATSLFHFYADRDLTITGTIIYEHEWFGYTTEIYDCSFKKGWNVFYFIEEWDNDNTYYNLTLTTKEPSGITFNWYYSDATCWKTPAANLRDKHLGKILTPAKR